MQKLNQIDFDLTPIHEYFLGLYYGLLPLHFNQSTIPHLNYAKQTHV